MTCLFCECAILASDSRTSSVDGPAHTRCWNDAAEERRAYAVECEDAEGFRDRAPVRCAASAIVNTSFEKGRVA